jgi:hypothetical protein
MNYATVKDVITSFPRPILPTVQGEPDYQTIHPIRKLLQANARAIDTHAMVAPATEAGPTLWVNITPPGRATDNTDGTAAQIGAAIHSWEEAVLTYRTYTSVQQALKKQIITVFEPMYLDILNDGMVVFENIAAQEMLDHIFMTYGIITAVNLEKKLNK